MPKLTALLIASAYMIYFLLTPLLTINDEVFHQRIIVGVSQGRFLYTGGNNQKEINAIKKISDSINFVDHPFQLPKYNSFKSFKEEKNDYNLDGIYSHQAYSPPLYYIAGAILYRISKVTQYLFAQFYFLRLTSTLFYIGTVFIAWKILLIFFKNKNIASSILIFFAINPLVLKMGIGINPDIGVTFFSLWVLYFLLKSLKSSLVFKNLLIIGVLTALATMTKISGVFTNLAFSIYAVAIYGLNKKTAFSIALFQVLFLAFTLPWFIFIHGRYNTFFPEAFTSVCSKLGQTLLGTKIFDTFATFRFTIMNYAGFMGEGWPHPFGWFFAVYTVLFIFFLVVGIIFVIRQKKLIYRTTLIYLSSLVLFLLVTSAGFRIKEIDCDIQGRYLLPVFFVLCLYVYFGITRFVKKEKNAALIMRGFAIFHYLFVLFTVIILRYYV